MASAAQIPTAQVGDRLALRLGDGGVSFCRAVNSGLEEQVAVAFGTTLLLTDISIASQLRYACDESETVTVSLSRDGPLFVVSGKSVVISPLDIWESEARIDIVVASVPEERKQQLTVIEGGKVA